MAMNYELIDPILKDWAVRHQLAIQTEYKDSEVRSIEIVKLDSSRFQIWVDPPSADSNIRIHVWDYKKRRKDLFCPISGLFQCLEIALDQVRQWN